MVLHLSFQDSNKDILDLSECGEIFLGGGASMLNITANLDEINRNWKSFERTLFIADLLGVNGIFILGNEDAVVAVKIKTLYLKSSFSEFENVIYSSENRQDFVYPKRKRPESVTKPGKIGANELRTIVIWENSQDLKEGDVLTLNFFNGEYSAEVLQIQKIISPDYNGSTFGVKELKPKGIGTVLFKADKAEDIYIYEDKPEQGFFEIKNEKEMVGYGIVIKS